MLDIQRDIADRDGRSFFQSMMDVAGSWEASERATLRHASTNQQKATLLAEWDAQGREYKSRADFARIVSKRDGVKYRTLYDWIAQHDSEKA